MKYLKTFEVRDITRIRKVKYQYLSKEDENKLEKFVEKFIIDKNKISLIDELVLDNFVDDSFYYNEIWNSILVAGRLSKKVMGLLNQYQSNSNIYYEVDEFCRDNNIKGSAPAIRNSLSRIVDKMYKKFDIKDKLDKVLIKILEKQPQKYKSRFELYEDELNNIVKDACKWMLVFQNYNL